ncbi:MAG: TerC family protein [Crocinitomicaceae bacterium]|nr:TerC family protein [Crocinitomicaceae bacterium]
MDFSILLSWDGITYLIILSLLEIVLGIDNIIFISIVSDRLPVEKQGTARNVGLSLALIIRLILLSLVAWIMGMTEPLFTLFEIDFSGQSLVLLIGGLFLIYKSTTEMHNSVAGHEEDEKGGKVTLSGVITQIVLIDLVFSFDSVISAIGMTNGMAQETGENPMIIIYIAVIVSMIIMLLFAKQISQFINNRPTIKMIALGFLVTIGVILVAEAFGQHIPKGYIYFAMVYALFVEFLNIRMRKNLKKRLQDDK